MAAGLVFLVLLAARPAVAEVDQHTYRETKQLAMTALQAGAYEDAITQLEQLLAWYDLQTKDQSANAEIEDIMYNLGLCKLLLGQFVPARDQFDQYIKKFKLTARSNLIAIFVGDSFRYEKKYPDAMRAYNQALRTYRYSPDLEVDIYCSQVRCIIAGEDWSSAEPLLIKIYNMAPDRHRKNWAASILTILYLRDLKVDQVYELIPMLLQPNSFASRSVALNMSALEAGDRLYDEFDRYRDALWIYRLVYPYDVLMFNAETAKTETERRILWLQRTPGAVRQLLRAQETLSEINAEIEALSSIPVYDPELYFRMAGCYMQIKRFREGGDLFYDLYADGGSKYCEESLYLSFLCGTMIYPLDRAFSRGEEYMRVYPGERHYDELSLHLGQLYSDQKDWPNTIRVLAKAIEVSPKHQDIVECLYLLGYASFMIEKFDDAVTYLTRMNTDYPNNEREADGAYWMGMSHMFNKDFEDAAPQFNRVVQDFPDCPYVEDALFRYASCLYGESEFDPAEKTLMRFISAYPESKLMGEAHLMLGDISGQFGELEAAVAQFQRAVEYPLNIELYNHAYFRAGDMMKDLASAAKDPAAEKKWREAIVAHFERYMEADREDSNVPLAIYWIGTAYWDLGEYERALVVYQDAIEKYGEDRFNLGVDLIFEHWVGQAKNAPPELTEGTWKDLRGMLDRAIKQQRWALALRIQRILIYDPKVSDKEKEVLRDSLLRERNLANASPGVLEWIVREAGAAGMRDLQIKAAQVMVDDFTETDYALSARTVLAKAALDEKRYDDAIRHLTVIREVYATSPQAGPALLELGNVYIELKDYDKADKAFTDLTGERDWRDLWPAALYGRGQVAEARRKFQDAAALYERIYVMYSGYEEWVIKAYLARSRILRRMQEYSKAREVMDEFIALRHQAVRNLPDEQFEALPEIVEAREELNRAQGRMR